MFKLFHLDSERKSWKLAFQENLSWRYWWRWRWWRWRRWQWKWNHNYGIPLWKNCLSSSFLFSCYVCRLFCMLVLMFSIPKKEPKRAHINNERVSLHIEFDDKLISCSYCGMEGTNTRLQTLCSLTQSLLCSALCGYIPGLELCVSSCAIVRLRKGVLREKCPCGAVIERPAEYTPRYQSHKYAPQSISLIVNFFFLAALHYQRSPSGRLQPAKSQCWESRKEGGNCKGEALQSFH